MATEQKIQSSAEKNKQLLKALSETDYAISAHQQSNQYIDSLEKQIAEEVKKLKDLSKIVALERLDHEKYRDSTFKKFTYKVRGKKDDFAQKATKEEKEWLDAVQHELTAKKGVEQLRSKLAEAQGQNADLVGVLSQRTATQAELEKLYNSIFNGPTPDIPGEDEKEAAVREAEQTFNAAQLKLSTETQAKSVLLDADKFLKRAIGDIKAALDANEMDCWGFGDNWAAMHENSSLGACQSHVSQAEMLINQANRIQPAVTPLVGGLEVARMNFMGDVLFDNVFSDMAMRDKLHATEKKLFNAQNALKTELHNANDRQQIAQSELDQAKLVLDGNRKELQQIRAEAFDRITGSNLAGVLVPNPPGYEGAALVPNEQPPAYGAQGNTAIAAPAGKA